MKIKASTLLTLIFILSSGILAGQPFDAEKIDSLLDYLAGKNKAMGSLALSRDGSIVYSKAVGYSLLTPQNRIKSDEDTRYRIGSVTKMFTATLVFQLIEEGKVDLTTTLDKYYPEVPNAGRITIAHLLGHRSGIHSFTDDSAYLKWMTSPKTHDEMIRIISSGRPEFRPGLTAAYSNSNYVLLGYIVERICNKTYNEVLRERICTKIGLTDTYYGGKSNPAQHESFSYAYESLWVQKPETDMSIPHGAGALVSTPSDLVRFIEALFAGQLISEKSLNQIKTITDGIGMGMFLYPFLNKTAYGHTGSIDGFGSTLGYFPEDKVAFAYISNGTIYPALEVLFGALKIFFNLPYEFPVFTFYFVPQEELDQYLGMYSSPQMPVQITLTKNNGMLYGQATGQPALPLEAVDKNVFKLEMVGAIITFNPDKRGFVMEQGGRKFTFTKVKQ
jgi:CubicO group peptidase (beta-lactamase class C family)